jgi:hypothetical protein
MAASKKSATTKVMTTFRSHQKQFVLGPEPVRVRPDWISFQLADRVVLSCCPKLRATRLRSLDGKEYFLLGVAVLADVPATIPELFQTKSSSEIEDWTAFWAGKWALISAASCLQDVSGCLGIYYREHQGTVWLSSSPALLSDHLPGAAPLPRIPWKITHETGIDWIPVPLTTREHVYKLLPGRKIAPGTGAITPTRFAAASGVTDIDDRALASTLKMIVANWARMEFRERFVTLTAGVDTRTILAAVKASNLDIETCTTKHPHTPHKDVALPPRLAASVGLRHTFLGFPKLDAGEIAARQAAIAEHLDGATFHPVTRSFAEGSDDVWHDSGRTIAAGHVFGVAKCYFWETFAKAGLGATPPSTDQLLRAFFPQPPEPLPFWREAMESWLESLSDPVPLQVDWRDRFYLDQRLGGWNSEVQRLMDLLDCEFFYPGNCLWVFHLLFRDPPEKRQEAQSQKRAIKILEPRLMKFPINPPRLSKRMKNAAKNAVKALVGVGAARKLKSFSRRLRTR